MEIVKKKVRYVDDFGNIRYKTEEKEDTKELLQLNPSDFISSLMGSSSSMMGAGITIFGELINDDAMVKEQYEMIEGRWPTKFDELMVVLPDEDSVSDLLLYALGLRDLNELEDMIAKIIDGEKVIMYWSLI